jgi:type IV pilus assembly protein PilC
MEKSKNITPEISKAGEEKKVDRLEQVKRVEEAEKNVQTEKPAEESVEKPMETRSKKDEEKQDQDNIEVLKKPLPKKASKKISLKKNFYFNTGKDKEMFFQNVALMVASGINIQDAVSRFTEEYKSKYMKELGAFINRDLDNGVSFANILAKYKLVPGHSLSIIRIAEESGNLPDTLKLVIEQIQKEKEFRSQLRSAAFYPVIVIVLLIVVTLGMGLFVIPKFTDIYKSLRIELPWITQVIIDFGGFMSEYGAIVTPVTLIGLVLLGYLLFFNTKTKFIGQSLLFRIPGVGNFIMETEVARMAYIMSSLLSRGFQVLEAVAILQSSTTLHVYKKFYDFLYDSINSGASLKKCFTDYKGIQKLFPLYVRQLISTGEQTGELSKTLDEINIIYGKKNELASKNLATLFEPILLIAIAVGIGVVAVAVLLPIYNLMGNITDLSTPSSLSNQKPAPAVGTTDNATKKLPLLLIMTIDPGIFDVYDNLAGKEIAKVSQGQVYEYTDSKNGWYKIKLNNVDSGWIDGQFVKLF